MTETTIREMLLEVLREFPRSLSTLQWGAEQLYNCYMSWDTVSNELNRMQADGLVEIKVRHISGKVMYTLTQIGLAEQEKARTVQAKGAE